VSVGFYYFYVNEATFYKIKYLLDLLGKDFHHTVVLSVYLGTKWIFIYDKPRGAELLDKVNDRFSESVLKRTKGKFYRYFHDKRCFYFRIANILKKKEITYIF